jgi:hypothetical protein
MDVEVDDRMDGWVRSEAVIVELPARLRVRIKV